MAFITLDKYKDYKKLKSEDNDEKLVTIINGVWALIESYCDRSFTSQTVVEYHDAKSEEVYLKQFPVTSVTSVETSTNGGLTYTALSEDASNLEGYFVDLEDGVILTQKSGYKFLTDYNIPFRSLKVTYVYGYEDNALPNDLRLAAYDLIDYYKDGEHVPVKTFGAATIQNAFPVSERHLPAHVKRVLDMYRVAV